jgi:tRNA(adenine34) deaminase
MDAQALDREMMQRCIELSVQSGRAGEYPYGVVISRNGKVVAESINRVRHEHDVTRHAEVVAISAAQKALGAVSLDDCTIYVSAESCAYCCYAIRESRIGRVVYGLRSPHMGGVSKWPILPDEDLSNTMPEVFAAPPEMVAGFMAAEAEEALLKYNPVSGGVMKLRRLFIAGPVEKIGSINARRRSLKERTFAFLRRMVFDRFGRS